MSCRNYGQVFSPPILKLSNIDHRFGGQKRMMQSSPILPGRYR